MSTPQTPGFFDSAANRHFVSGLVTLLLSAFVSVATVWINARLGVVPASPVGLAPAVEAADDTDAAP